MGLKFNDSNDESSQDSNMSTNFNGSTNKTDEGKVLPFVPDSSSDTSNEEFRRSNRIKKAIDRVGNSHSKRGKIMYIGFNKDFRKINIFFIFNQLGNTFLNEII